jgi:hypothetical protein
VETGSKSLSNSEEMFPVTESAFAKLCTGEHSFIKILI